MRPSIAIAASIVALTLLAAIVLHELVLDSSNVDRAQGVVERGSAFCGDYLRMTPESRHQLLRTRAGQFLFAGPDRAGLAECLSSYVVERAAAVERKCRDRGDFEAGSTLGQILVVGLRECRRQADAGE